MKKSILQLILIHFKEFVREPGIWLWSIVFPIVMAWVLGVAFTSKDTLNQKIGVVRLSQIKDSSWVSFLRPAKKTEYGFERSVDDKNFGRINYQLQEVDWNEAMVSLKRGIFSVLILQQDGRLVYRFDPKNSDAKLNYLQLSKAIEGGEQNSSNKSTISPLTQIGTRYIDFLVPGLMALGLMNSFIWGVAYSLIEMRTKKLLRRMVATPMLKSDFLISHYVARLSLNIFESAILLIFAKLYFSTRIEGSLWAFAMVYFSGTVAFTGISILVGSRTDSMRVAHGLMNAITMPAMVLSGIFFSYHNFPDAVLPLIRYQPLTLIADNLRSVFIEGAGVSQVLVPSCILSGIGLVCFAIGMKIYRWY